MISIVRFQLSVQWEICVFHYAFQSAERARKFFLDFQKCGKVYLFLHAFLIRNVLSKNVAKI